MSFPKCSDEEFIELIETLGVTKTAEHLGVKLRSVNQRRNYLERTLHRPINAPDAKKRVAYPARIELDIPNGIVLVGSDPHYWPDYVSTAHRAFVQFCAGKHLKSRPKVIIMNGDVFDGARASRFPPIEWESPPTIVEEIATVQERLREIKKAARDAKLFWPVGNHDARFSGRLSAVAPEFAGVHGTSLNDHFPAWQTCWSVFLNDDVLVKHRWKTGVHATYNNTIKAGVSMITGHLHSLKVAPFSDVRETRWGVDCGTMADVHGSQFINYTEDNPKDWRSGFIVLTFKNGELLWPEIVYVRDENHIEFRGEIIKV